MKKDHKLELNGKKVALTIIAILLVGYIILAIIYQTSLGIVSTADAKKETEIKKGTTTKEIAHILKEKNLIKNEFSFLLYIRLHNVKDLKFGTYLLSENMGVKTIVEYLQNGSDYNPDEVTVTFQEGLNMREIARVIERNTDNTYDEVIAKSNDVEYIKTLQEKYWFITNDILNDQLFYKLEGYLFPDTYQLKDKKVTVEYIFEKMLDQMAKQLEGYKDFDYSKMSIHERLTLASMAEKESAVKKDRNKITSVFLNRKARGMNLGSDVTARYANKIDDRSKALSSAQLEIKSPYNTRLSDGSMNGKLPVGPIAAVSRESIEASFAPDEHAYLYFISNIQTQETFFYEDYNEFLTKKDELKEVNKGF